MLGYFVFVMLMSVRVCEEGMMMLRMLMLVNDSLD